MPAKDQMRRLKRQERFNKTKGKQIGTKEVRQVDNRSQNDVKKLNVMTSNMNLGGGAFQIGSNRVPYNMTDADMNTVLNPQGYLEDIHMDCFSSMMRAMSEFRPQPTSYIVVPNRIVAIPQGTPHLQIMFLRQFGPKNLGHWVSSYYDGATVAIFDSLNSGILHQDVNTYLERLFPFRPPVRIAKVQRQTNGFDCGLFAIAFCTSILLGRDPESETYDISKLRMHAVEIFRTRQVTLFPVIRQQLKSQNYIKRKTEETKEQRTKRLRQLSENKSIRTSNETIDEKNKRLLKLQIDYGNYVSNETPAEKKLRLKRCRDDKIDAQAQKKLTRVETIKTYKLASKGLEQNIQPHSLGPMNVICKECLSKNFLHEKPADGKFTHCCRKGKLAADKIVDFPEYLKNLMIGNDTNSSNFRFNIRSYNSSLAFASMGAQIDQIGGKGPYTFKIHGQIYHNTSAMYPNNGKVEKFAQLYIIDTNEALSKRLSFDCNKQCRAAVMTNLDRLIREVNPFYAAFMMLKEVDDLEQQKAIQNNSVAPEISLWICQDRSKDQRRYNLPTSNEVAVVFTANEGEPPANRDICIHPRGKSFVRIKPQSPNCDPMTYPLLFPRGESGWSLGMKHIDGIKKVTPLQFYTNRIADRPYFNPCLHAGKLTQQYLVDAYVKVESERLMYIRQNQASLRVELYNGLMDHINNLAANESAKPGTMVILPTTFQGGSRFMQQMYQNAMAIVREYGKPDLFVTATCNPRWPEIKEQLLQNETASDRPDIVARVFQGKIKSMLKDFLVDEVFGTVIAYIYVIEFQKRGLPHMHLLMFLDSKDKIRNKDDIDALVSAEIPNFLTEPELYQIVKANMVHGPCGSLNNKSPCMNENKCSKKYPRAFREETFENTNGYPIYRRRDNGETIDILWKNGTVKYTIDNRWIIPYNPYLSKKYNAHINVEICASVKSVKYICDYLCKGHDCASVKLGQVGKSKTVNWDEINAYLDARYVSAPESCWRLMEYPLHSKSHAVFQLAVHLQYQQSVVFTIGQEQKAIERASKTHTTLTAWFELNKTDNTAHQFHYSQIPKHYVFTNKHTWQKRQRENKPPIGRMIAVSPKDIERFHLRLLLVHATGAKSFDDLRKVDGIVYSSYIEAARAKGLLASNDECEKCMREAVLDKFPRQLRELFAFLLCFHTSCDALKLWNEFKDDLMEDFSQKFSPQVSEHKCLTNIRAILAGQGFQLKDFNLPEPVDNFDDTAQLDETFDVDAERAEGEQNSALFNQEQRDILDKILLAIDDPNCSHRYFFVDGPGGSGKTFLYNTIISILRGRKLKVISVAFTGIAATLLKGGVTAHSAFKLPVPIVENSVCKIRGNSAAGRLIKDASIIIWDEITMAPCHALRAVNVILKDLTGNPRPFGGKVVVLGGDFRQCLPIVNFTNHRTAIIEISMLRSIHWPLFKQYSLTKNMRVNQNEQEFSNFLLRVGNGEETEVQIPERCVETGSLTDAIFGTNPIKPDDIYQYINRAILSPKNDDTMLFNEVVLEKIVGPTKTYFSADTAECDDDNKLNYPTELLNKQTPTGLPPYKLNLKIGSIVMLLRNMNPKRGLCNGTRLIVKQMRTNYLDLEVVSGQSKGERIFLPRIDLTPSDSNLPFILKRRQFPIRLAFSMTINKSQGQTFDRVGINLQEPVFTHGQLYVAMSRVRSFDSLKVKLPNESINNVTGDGKTANIVFTEILK